MESRTPRPVRTTCSVPGLLLGLSKLCELTKVCAAPDVTNTKTEFGEGGGYDQRLVIIILFEAIGALKSAYIKLQKAHIPYDSTKIAFSDEIITSELDSVTALQCLSSTSGGVGSLINERWSLVQELGAEMRKKESDIVLLRRELDGLQRANSTLNKKIKKKSSVRHDKVFVVPKQLTTPSAFLELFKVASTSVHDFAELITSLMVSSSDHCVSNADEQLRKRYSLEAYLSWTMLGGGTGTEEEEGFDAACFDRIMRSCDPLDALMEDPCSSFSRFCRSKYLAAVSSETEAAMFRKLDQRVFVSRGGHPRTWFYRAFATMARSTWALQMVIRAHCFAHGVTMFYAKRGSKYAEEHMESVAALGGKEEEKLSTVAFTVTPGFKNGDTVVACRVLLCHPEDGAISSTAEPKFSSSFSCGPVVVAMADVLGDPMLTRGCDGDMSP